MQEKNKNVIYGRYRGTFLKDNCKTNLGENSNTKNRKRKGTYEGQNAHHEQSEQT
jgi:hypothetical protein